MVTLSISAEAGSMAGSGSPTKWPPMRTERSRNIGWLKTDPVGPVSVGVTVLTRRPSMYQLMLSGPRFQITPYVWNRSL